VSCLIKLLFSVSEPSVRQIRLVDVYEVGVVEHVVRLASRVDPKVGAVEEEVSWWRGSEVKTVHGRHLLPRRGTFALSLFGEGKDVFCRRRGDAQLNRGIQVGEWKIRHIGDGGIVECEARARVRGNNAREYAARRIDNGGRIRRACTDSNFIMVEVRIRHADSSFVPGRRRCKRQLSLEDARQGGLLSEECRWIRSITDLVRIPLDSQTSLLRLPELSQRRSQGVVSQLRQDVGRGLEV